MSKYTCPRCDGGFAAPTKRNNKRKCPWCHLTFGKYIGY